MTTKQYTAEDFVNAEFARHPSGVVAARFYDRGGMPWLTADDISLSNEDMADLGWVPVQEAAAQPVTLDALRDAWEGAEQGEVDKGDILICHGESEHFIVWSANHGGHTSAWLSGTRILRRAPKPPRPEGAEQLEALLDEWGDLTRDEEPTSLADWLAERLAERGVRVTEAGYYDPTPILKGTSNGTT